MLGPRCGGGLKRQAAGGCAPMRRERNAGGIFFVDGEGTVRLSMLELRPNCELCDADLPPDSPEAGTRRRRTHYTRHEITAFGEHVRTRR